MLDFIRFYYIKKKIESIFIVAPDGGRELVCARLGPEVPRLQGEEGGVA